MIANPSFDFLTPEDYLKFEQDSPVKHEYRDGQAYAMAGATDAHVTIAGNFFALLRSHVRGGSCRVYIADMKAHVEKVNTYYYPDVMVTCDERDRAFNLFKRYPCVIVEVLSDSTEAFDRGDKFSDYRHMDSLQEYVLISQTRKRIDRFWRNAEGQWVLSSFEEPDTLPLTSIGFSCAVADVYEDVELSARPPAET
jgi:Uma2 family endonuclease